MIHRRFGLVLSVAVGCSACGDSGNGGGGEGGEVGKTTTATKASSAMSGDSSSSGSPGCGRLADGFVVPACGECAETSCCAELADCDVDSDCATVRACIQACDTPACADQCTGTDAAGAAASDALDACLAKSCSAQCAPPGDGVCDTTFTTQDRPCDTCLDESCCPEVTACAASAACSACLGQITLPACNDDPLLAAMTKCFSDQCSSDCDG